MERLKYDKTLELQIEYGNEVVCGYIRNPMIEGKKITGLCALFEGLECSKNVPMNVDNCSKYKERFG